ncbi:MAG: DUF819 family protein [Elusimicrobia bacterium]|nr:DUF819 family protein [Elusimicrobiota bacterium]
MIPVFCAGLGIFSVYAGSAWGPRITDAFSGISPRLASAFSPATWTILFVTTLSLAVSLTRRFSVQSDRTERWGTALLFLLLASMGARARLTAIVSAPLFLAFGLLLMVIHGAILFAGGRVLRAPLFLLATASQACVGGPVSAPLVAAVYRPALSAVGLLLAILGNVLGTYLGLLNARLCEWIGTF